MLNKTAHDCGGGVTNQIGLISHESGLNSLKSSEEHSEEHKREENSERMR